MPLLWLVIEHLRRALVVGGLLAVLTLPTWTSTAYASGGPTSPVMASGQSNLTFAAAHVRSSHALPGTFSWSPESSWLSGSPCGWSGLPFGEASTSPPLTEAECLATFQQATAESSRRTADVVTLGLGLLCFCGGVVAASTIGRR